MHSFRSVGIIAKPGDARALETRLAVARLLGSLLPAGGRLLVPDTAPAALAGDGLEALPLPALVEACDLAIVIGGDGTLLAAARAFAPAKVPLLGINRGRLGFLVDISPEGLQEALQAVFDGRYSVEERLILEARLRSPDCALGPPHLAINDVVVRNQASIRMLEFETMQGEESIGVHRADGLIVSTPTGSTAYALSGGGPILHPSLDAIALVPICPHSFSDRPVVVSADRTIRVSLLGDTRGATITCDGQLTAAIDCGDSVEIQRSPHRLRLVHPPGFSYFGLLRDKLQWGRSPGEKRRD